MTTIRIQTLRVAFVLGAVACSAPRHDANATSDSNEQSAPDSTDNIVRVVVGDTTRLPANRLRIKVIEDVPHRSHGGVH